MTTEGISIGGEWTTYRRADGEDICGEYAWMDSPDIFDDLDDATEVVVETWVLASREMRRMGPLDLCATCHGECEIEAVGEGSGETVLALCPDCHGSGEEQRP